MEKHIEWNGSGFSYNSCITPGFTSCAIFVFLLFAMMGGHENRGCGRYTCGIAVIQGLGCGFNALVLRMMDGSLEQPMYPSQSLLQLPTATRFLPQAQGYYTRLQSFGVRQGFLFE